MVYLKKKYKVLPYLVILFILVSFSLGKCLNLTRNKKNVVSFFILMLLLFSGLRYDVGMDYSAYEELYHESLNKLNPEIKEFGWGISSIGFETWEFLFR